MRQLITLLALIVFFSCKEKSTEKNDLQEESMVLDSVKTEKLHDQQIKQVSYDKEKSFIKSFYKDYISEIEGLEVDTSKIQSILDKYCSSKLIKAIKSAKELDYDPFIDAQDVPPKFLKSIEIDKVDGKENRFVASYLFGEVRNNIELDLVKEENQLKIDKVYTINKVSAFDNIID
ncbi:hypothetical protein MHTCC0001_35470 [Flavobacteriaceae bacterium MHTCC 0001]